MSKKCTVCGKEIEDGATECKFCGAPAPIQDNFLITTPGSSENKKIEKLLNTRNKIAGLITLLIYTLLQVGVEILPVDNVASIYALDILLVFVVGFVTILRWKSRNIKQEFISNSIFIFLGIFFLWFKTHTITSNNETTPTALNTAPINVGLIIIVLGVILMLITLWKKYH